MRSTLQFKCVIKKFRWVIKKVTINTFIRQKWLMDSKMSGKPKYLTYKDLKKDTGKGFYHWMRPYERFEAQSVKSENILPLRLPRAFIFRSVLFNLFASDYWARFKSRLLVAQCDLRISNLFKECGAVFTTCYTIFL